MTLLIVPSLPAASMPWRTTSTDRFPSAQKRSCSVRRRTSCSAVVLAEIGPVVAVRGGRVEVLETHLASGLDRADASEGHASVYGRTTAGRVTGPAGRPSRA